MAGLVRGLAVLIVTLASPSAQAWPGCSVDRIHAVVAEDTVTVFHDAAAYNCCMDSVTYSVAQTSGRIEIVETERLTNFCTCLCCFDLSVQVEDVAPGTYALVLSWHDDETGQDEVWSEEIIVLGGGQGHAFVASSSSSGCLPMPGVSAGAGGEVADWGCLKSRYR